MIYICIHICIYIHIIYIDKDMIYICTVYIILRHIDIYMYKNMYMYMYMYDVGVYIYIYTYIVTQSFSSRLGRVVEFSIV